MKFEINLSEVIKKQFIIINNRESNQGAGGKL